MKDYMLVNVSARIVIYSLVVATLLRMQRYERDAGCIADGLGGSAKP